MTVHAPYNFVPLADTIVLPKWGARVSHDLPFKDGASGALNFTLTNDTELIVGDGSSPQDVQQFRLPNGQAAIPGSSLRGMIRAVLEVATFSRFRQVDDSRFGVRDLTSGARPFYGRVISHEVNGAFEALSKAGWLSFDGQHWSVSPCDVARVEHDDLATLTGDNWWLSVPRDPAGNSAAKYANFDGWAAGKGLAARKIFFQPGPVANHQHSGKLLRYRRASGLSANPAATLTAGTVVFTGQPAPRVPGTPGRKHLEFIFFGGGTKVIAVDDRVMSGFLQIHDDSDEWKRMRTDGRVPVFYLESTGEIESLGLAQMYRLAYRNTVHDVVRHTSAAHLEGTDPDFCDLLFGRTDEAADASLKSRAWFEPAVARVVTPSPVRTVVLSNPKPSYYPSYVRQRANDGNLIGDYTTWSNTNAQLRGWKRYPARTGITQGAPATDKVSTKLHPLPAGTRFDCRLIFHNLKREELGAILWALTWGGERSLRHSLGMGKPYGYGSVQFEIDDKNAFEIEWNDPARSEPPTADELLKVFADYMTVQAPGWSSRPQLIALKAMANPATASAVNLEYMTLDPQHHHNEFQDAKKASPHQVLPEYPGVPAVPSHAVPHLLPKAALDHPPHTTNVTPVVPTEPEVWRGVTLTFGREGGVAVVTARNGQKVATEKLDTLKQSLTGEQAIAGLAEAENRWRRDRPVIADVTVMLRGRLSYRIIDLVFKS